MQNIIVIVIIDPNQNQGLGVDLYPIQGIEKKTIVQEYIKDLDHKIQEIRKNQGKQNQKRTCHIPEHILVIKNQDLKFQTT